MRSESSGYSTKARTSVGTEEPSAASSLCEGEDVAAFMGLISISPKPASLTSSQTVLKGMAVGKLSEVPIEICGQASN
jgi:hypothetical protein